MKFKLDSPFCCSIGSVSTRWESSAPSMRSPSTRPPGQGRARPWSTSTFSQPPTPTGTSASGLSDLPAVATAAEPSPPKATRFSCPGGWLRRCRQLPADTAVLSGRTSATSSSRRGRTRQTTCLMSFQASPNSLNGSAPKRSEPCRRTPSPKPSGKTMSTKIKMKATTAPPSTRSELGSRPTIFSWKPKQPPKKFGQNLKKFRTRKIPRRCRPRSPFGVERPATSFGRSPRAGDRATFTTTTGFGRTRVRRPSSLTCRLTTWRLRSSRRSLEPDGETKKDTSLRKIKNEQFEQKCFLNFSPDLRTFWTADLKLFHLRLVVPHQQKISQCYEMLWTLNNYCYWNKNALLESAAAILVSMKKIKRETHLVLFVHSNTLT